MSLVAGQGHSPNILEVRNNRKKKKKKSEVLSMLHGHGHGHDTDTDTRIRQFLKNKDTTRRGHGG